MLLLDVRDIDSVPHVLWQLPIVFILPVMAPGVSIKQLLSIVRSIAITFFVARILVFVTIHRRGLNLLGVKRAIEIREELGVAVSVNLVHGYFVLRFKLDSFLLI